MKLLPRTTPIAIHFGSLETRLLQLHEGRGGWKVHAWACWPAEGPHRFLEVARKAAPELKGLRIKGTDTAFGLGGKAVSLAMIPIDPQFRERMIATLEQAAARAVEDEEGLEYRYLKIENIDNEMGREEYLLLAAGSSVLRRVRSAAQGMRLRPVSLEAEAFALARALAPSHPDSDRPWAFLHLGYEQALFGIHFEGELRFLKPMQTTGEDLLRTEERGLTPSSAGAEPGTPWSFDRAAEEGEVEDGAAPGAGNPALALRNQVIGAAEDHCEGIRRGLRQDALSLAQEIKACLRHFATRNRGAVPESIELSGFGVSLPEVARTLADAFDLPTRLASPFRGGNIQAPLPLLQQEAQWSAALGLAMRGFA